MESFRLFKNSISKKSSKNFFNFIVKLVNSYDKDFPKDLKYSGWDDPKFNKFLLSVRKKKDLFSAIYNTALKSNELQKIPFENNFHKIASKFLNVDKGNLTIRNITFRMDPPKDKKNSYGWHQDSAYDKFNVESKNGAILWIPLTDTNKKNGTLVVKIGSENTTYNCSKLVYKGSKYRSQQILVDKKYLKKYKSKHIPVKQNNALVCFNGLFHKSGINSSNKFRFTIIVRYGNMFAQDFIFRRGLKGNKK